MTALCRKSLMSGRTIMMTKSKFAVIAALAVSAAAPAYAQSVDRIGSPLPYYYDSAGGQIRGSWSAPAASATRHVGAPLRLQNRR
jgi:hypothetical protein